MRLLALSLILVCCMSCRHTGNGLLTSPHPDDAKIVFVCASDFEDVTYSFQTNRGALRRTPRWKSDAEFPPLSPRRAGRAALLRAQQLRPDVQKWRLESICLDESGDDAWYYLFTFARGDIPITGLPQFLQVPVLMDGLALPATIPENK